MNTIILGAGLSGCLAGLVHPDATIYESKTESQFLASPEHKAVLRFRTNNISNLTGIPFKEVQVRKSIWYDDKEYKFPETRLANMYSKKVSGGYYDRSVLSLETVQRFLPPIDFHQRILSIVRSRVSFGCKISGINKDHFCFLRDGARQDEDSLVNRDGPIISTIAMPIMAKLIGEDSPVNFSSGKKIYVIRYKLSDCNMNISMYYPDPYIPVYRASVMGNVLSIELVEDLFKGTKDALNFPGIRQYVTSSMGIQDEDLQFLDEGSQLGKINYQHVDDTIRKNWILKLSLKYNIYSLGRFAIWKNILQDDVYHDVYQIRSFINSGTFYDFYKEHVNA